MKKWPIPICRSLRVMSWWHRRFTWKPQSSLTLREKPMKLASGFCIPEPLPLHTGIKGRQVHPLIRSLLRSRVDENVLDEKSPQSLSSLFCSWLASRCSQRSPSQQRFPWALRLKEPILKESFSRCCSIHVLLVSCLQMTDTSVVFSVWAFVDDSCACCGRMSMTSLRSCLSFLKGLAPCAATRSGLSGLSRRPPAGALEDLRVTVRASSPGTSPRTSYFSCVERPV